MPLSSTDTNRFPLRQLTVVVIGRNEGDRLRRCLESVFAQRLEPQAFDVVYVDSGSSDGSPDLAEAMGARTIVLQGAPMSAARGRNAGWQSTSADFVLFLDGDTILDPDFAARHLPVLRADPTLAAVFGRRREIAPRATMYNRVLDIDWIREPGPQLFFGGDALVRRSCLEAASGYDEHLVAGEEPELCRRLRERGWRIVSVDAPMTLHDLAMTSWRQYWRRAIRTGLAYAQVSARFRNTADPLWAREARHHAVSGLFWLALVTISITASLLLQSGIPAAAGLAAAVTLFLRSAWKQRHRCPDAWTALLYGVHSQIQHVPILFGQIEHYRRKSTRETGLIEYKDTPKAAVPGIRSESVR